MKKVVMTTKTVSDSTDLPEDVCDQEIHEKSYGKKRCIQTQNAGN